MVHSWATGRAVGEATADVNITKKMGINIFQWCRDICSWTLINGSTILLGGPGAIVQIDESVLTHQGKVANMCLCIPAYACIISIYILHTHLHLYIMHV